MIAPKNDTWLASALDWLEASAIPITLFLNGMVITGEAISPAVYYRGLGEQLGSIAERAGNQDESFRQYFSTLAADSEAAAQEIRARLEEQDAAMPPWIERSPDQDATVDRLVRNYVQLRDVTAIMNESTTLNVRYWRGRLSEVAGWYIGRAEIGTSKIPDPTRM